MKSSQTLADAFPEAPEGTAAKPASAPDDSSPRHDGIVSRLFKQQAKKVRHFLAFRLRSAEDAEDAAQEVFLRLWRHEQGGTLRDEATSYMFSAAYSIATDTERSRKHDHEHFWEDEVESIPMGQPSVEDECHWRGAVARLVCELEELSMMQRRVFVLHHFRDLTYVQIAKRLGVSVRTVERNLILAHRELKKHIKDYL